jgi:Flp pilus assembly protein TadD
VVEVSFADHSAGIRVAAAGEFMKMGEIDPKAGAGIELTPEQAAMRTWKPDAETWEKIKRQSVKSPATIVISGFADKDQSHPVSSGSVTISTSEDPVGAPVFYRDVPLKATPSGEKGSIQPLPQSALPLIKWQLRDIGETRSHTVMENLPTCANCHSFSRDGKTLGLDLDGPRNDKGLYALVPVSKNMTIRNQDVIRWSAFQVNPEARSSDPAVKRFGFMSQVSPDGRYVITSIGPSNTGNTHGKEIPVFAAGILDRLYSTNYPDFRFLQVFYPTRGILAYYDREEQKMRPLPGADDPQYVQTSAFWSPDGKYLIFSRAAARDPYPSGAPKPVFANDPNEPQIQYDLYKIPFNEGRGGQATPVEGASGNGMSNNFPKVSPDGRWIVFVQNRNGLLMRPDSKLYIVPFVGGQARRMNCNTSLMNSWHSFSPNGRWLAFSSKARSPFTQLMLTHIDADGNDTPAILVENATAANRAVNIPEFANVPPGGIEKIDPQATDFYRLVDQASALMQDNKIPEAIQTLRKAIQLDPEDALTHYYLAVLLTKSSQETEALTEYRKACALNPANATYLDHLGMALASSGDRDGAIEQLQKAIALQPGSAEHNFNLARLLELRGDYAGAVAPLQKAVELSKSKNGRFLAELASAYYKTGHSAEAIQSAKQALDLALDEQDVQLAKILMDDLDRYEHNGAAAKPQ